MSHQYMNVQRGTTLIEVLVTILIVSIGLLGMANLQLQSMKLNRSALNKLQAVNLANEIADSIFVNSLEAENSNYTISLDNQVNTAPSNTVANLDIAQWLTRIKKLPDGRLQISDPISMSGVSDIRMFDITICWQDSTEQTTNACGDNQGRFIFRASSREKT